MFEKEIKEALLKLSEVSSFISGLATKLNEFIPGDVESSVFLTQLNNRFINARKQTCINDLQKAFNEPFNGSDCSDCSAVADSTAVSKFNKDKMESEKHFFYQKIKEKIEKKMFTLKDCTIRQKNNIYEIRFRKFGISKSKSAKTKLEAMHKMQEYLTALNRELKRVNPKLDCNLEIEKPKMFIDIAEYFMYKIKKPNVKKNTFISYESKYLNYIKAKYENSFLIDLTPMCLQEDLSKLRKQKGKTYEDVKMLLSGIFNYAKANGFITTNPIDAVYLPPHERVNGTALTLDEERILLNKIVGSPYEKYILIMLYAGARPSEATETVIDWQEETITIKNSKLKSWQKIKYRTLPLFPMLIKYQTVFQSNDLNFTKNYLNDFFRKILPNHTLKDLRHTFATRAKECGVNPELVNIWQGHSAGKDMTAQVYTHYSMEYQKSQAKLLQYKS